MASPASSWARRGSGPVPVAELQRTRRFASPYSAGYERIAPEIALGCGDPLQDGDTLLRRALACLQQQADVVQQRSGLSIRRMIERQIIGAGLADVDGVDAGQNDGPIVGHIPGTRNAPRHAPRRSHGPVIGGAIERYAA